MIPFILPTSFRLGGHTWRVKVCKLTDLYGECDYDKHVIRIASEVNSKPTTEQTRFQTFIHEYYHAALHTLGREDDEEIVAGLEQMTWQLIKTARWKR